MRATSAAAAPPKSRIIGGAGTGEGPPEEPPDEPPRLDEPWPLLLQPLEPCQPEELLQPLEPLLLDP
ncbi:hypothetical protein P1X14_02525 [Sphingomonas sp. AOB5]|uniref:hypothetical protein n=1 Tax=Sphingomonas sp. AOB5 TaxID=3034017 RepID=UPI0023F73D0F|nr:hypothetical protein [Sphingomonas sp. AOB5]MDF7774110.1 hypothetical protein [Sphingomonas sp. AOB5]